MVREQKCKGYSFQEIASNITERVDPSELDNLPYIGLEHLQSDTFRVPIIGKSEDVNGQKIRMKKGDVLFGKRRAYQRKVGIAPCDGIFSAHGMVLRPKTDVMCEEYLPFFIRSDQFMERAISISVGSLSPTVNWGTLKNEKFKIPCIEDQKKLAELLWKLERYSELCQSRIEIYENLIKSRFIELFGNPNTSPKFEKKKIGSFANCYAGATPSTSVKEYWENGSIPWMSSGEVHQGKVTFTEKYITQEGFDNCSTRMVPPNSVVIALAGQGKTRGTVAITDIELCTNQSLCAIVSDESIEPIFLLHHLKLMYEQMREMSNGAGSRGGLNLKIIQSIEVMIPPIDNQNTFSEFVKQVDKSRLILLNHLANTKKLQNSIMNLGGEN